ncbi:GNAT family N-acetyltransferase [Sutcliffiella deserti]|uniref:GNAT family N-acetyltransferase n=1 Tax=Sutcliffiella deserti TaxID=2875501 RepID=UPI001CBB4CC9|nr:GNAT family N-acetyltransferase [Sutcliffiella deserti]
MNKLIRLLSREDSRYFEDMDTGVEDDYVSRIFERLTTGDHRLFGLFVDNRLVSIGGYSLFAKRYAMLGRLRTDRRFRGNNFSTILTEHIMKEAFKVSGVQWVGSNTQEDNLPARKVLEKLGLSLALVSYGAITNDTSALESGSKPWQRIHSPERKKEWIKEVYVKPSLVFPYECYYSFPASDDLFHEQELEKWSFYENEEQSRFLITKHDQKGHHYLHAVYPWNDLFSQKGLWETISHDYKTLKKQTGEDDTYIWMDLTKEAVKSLPSSHKFDLPSPWFLYGVDKK